MHYNLIYGSMAAVIGLMIWMYFVALVVMIGAAYNAVLMRPDDPGGTGAHRNRPREGVVAAAKP